MRWVLTVTVALAIGCAGESDRLDPATLEAAIPAALVPVAPELVTGVDCPEEISRGIGLATGCSASVSGTPVSVRVEQLDDDGNVRATTDTVLLDLTALAGDLAAELSADIGVEVTAVCQAPAVFVPAAGREIPCTARDSRSRPIEFVATLTDGVGGYEVRIAG